MPAALDRRPWLLAAGLALLAGLAVYALAHLVFPYHSINHDEAVYLQQAAMLLDGRLFVHPPVPEAFRPWFFVEDGGRLYPKYAPVPAAAFAAGLALGDPRLSLAVVGAALVALVYAVTAEALGPHPARPRRLRDRRTALLAAALALASPLFLVQASVFLPYAPTAVLTFAFAWAYLRADRLAGVDRSAAATGPADRARLRDRPLPWAALAGAAIGLAFFARPYTAVLFAAPFVGHALASLRGDGATDAGTASSRRDGGATDARTRSSRREGGAADAVTPSVLRGAGGALESAALARHGATAALGLAGVVVALAYNAVVTGDPLLFPYEVFAPRDGLGFGYRALTGHGLVYTPALALRANANALWWLGLRWTAAGPLGALLAAVGVGALLRRGRRADPRRLVLVGVVLSVVLGNLYFWGTLNTLGNPAVRGDGLGWYLGPYYHFALLLPLSAFGARGALLLGGRGRAALATATSPTLARVALAVAVIAGTVLAGAAVAEPVADNRRVTAEHAAAYEPLEATALDGALVFVPTPQGDWLAHPFQVMRNDPGLDGDVVYAIRERQFAVLDAYPDRRYYRYTYRGQWVPFAGPPVEAHLQPVRAVRGEAVTLDATLGLPAGVETVGVRLSSDAGATGVGVAPDGDRLSLALRLAGGRATLAGPAVDGTASVPLADRDAVVVEVFLDFGAGESLTYRLEVPVAAAGGEVRALTPAREVCAAPARCGGEAAYLPGATRPGVVVETALRTNGTASAG